MWSEVNNKVIDGNLQTAGETGEGIHVKIGIGYANTTDYPIQITSKMRIDEIQEILGLSPLADSCIDAIDNGAKEIYCIPVAATSAGKIGALSHTGTSAGTLELSGEPRNDFQLFIEIMESGNTNSGSFRYSIDGGRNYSDEQIIPLEGTFEIPDTGITIGFMDVEDSDTSFIAGDIYSAEATAPGTSNGNILEAVEKLRYMKLQMEYVHVVGASTEALWSSLGLLADEFFESYHKPISFVCETTYMQSEETLEAYVERLLTSARAVRNKNVQVVPAFAVYIRKDYRVQTINCASIATGFYSVAKAHESIGKTKKFVVSEEKMLKLMPEGIEKYLKELEAAGYLVMRQYDQKEGYFFANGKMMSPASSDYQYMEDVRVLNKIVKKVRQAALDELQEDIDMDEADLYVEHLKGVLGAGILECENEGNISSYEIDIPTDGVDILTNPEFDVNISYVPKGKNRVMNISFGVSRPITETGEE